MSGRGEVDTEKLSEDRGRGSADRALLRAGRTMVPIWSWRSLVSRPESACRPGTLPGNSHVLGVSAR